MINTQKTLFMSTFSQKTIVFFPFCTRDVCTENLARDFRVYKDLFSASNNVISFMNEKKWKIKAKKMANQICERIL